MADLIKAFAQVISNPSFIQGLTCGVSLFLIPKVVTYISRKTSQRAKRISERDDEEDQEDDDDDEDSDGFEDIDSADDDDTVVCGSLVITPCHLISSSADDKILC